MTRPHFTTGHHKADFVSPRDRIKHGYVMNRYDSKGSTDSAFFKEFRHKFSYGVLSHFCLPFFDRSPVWLQCLC